MGDRHKQEQLLYLQLPRQMTICVYFTMSTSVAGVQKKIPLANSKAHKVLHKLEY